MTETTTPAYRIEATPTPEQGHWADMRSAKDNLRSILECFAALERIAQGDAAAEDYEALEMSEDSEPFEYLDMFALDVRYNDSRVWLLLGCGGPHIELDLLRASDGRVEEIILRRYWGERDRAWTEDTRACQLADAFIEIGGFDA